MGPVFFVAAIMGCGDGAEACAPVRVEPVHYSTAAQCRAALPAALARNTDLDYPTLTAACQASGMQAAAQPRRERRG